VKAKKVVLATGSDARMLPGYTADETILTNIRDSEDCRDAEVAGGDRVGRGGG
jgi:dihydrolipoamide dehydrogenase